MKIVADAQKKRFSAETLRQIAGSENQGDLKSLVKQILDTEQAEQELDDISAPGAVLLFDVACVIRDKPQFLVRLASETLSLLKETLQKIVAEKDVGDLYCSGRLRGITLLLSKKRFENPELDELREEAIALLRPAFEVCCQYYIKEGKKVGDYLYQQFSNTAYIAYSLGELGSPVDPLFWVDYYKRDKYAPVSWCGLAQYPVEDIARVIEPIMGQGEFSRFLENLGDRLRVRLRNGDFELTEELGQGELKPIAQLIFQAEKHEFADYFFPFKPPFETDRFWVIGSKQRLEYLRESTQLAEVLRFAQRVDAKYPVRREKEDFIYLVPSKLEGGREELKLSGVYVYGQGVLGDQTAQICPRGSYSLNSSTIASYFAGKSRPEFVTELARSSVVNDAIQLPEFSGSTEWDEWESYEGKRVRSNSRSSRLRDDRLQLLGGESPESRLHTILEEDVDKYLIDKAGRKFSIFFFKYAMGADDVPFIGIGIAEYADDEIKLYTCSDDLALRLFLKNGPINLKLFNIEGKQEYLAWYVSRWEEPERY